MTPREIIARHLCTMAAQGWSGISAFERAAYRTTAAGMVLAITSAGYRILGPGELDPETLEKCAEVAEEDASYEQTEWGMGHRDACNSIANAIRALAKERQG